MIVFVAASPPVDEVVKVTVQVAGALPAELDEPTLTPETDVAAEAAAWASTVAPRATHVTTIARAAHDRARPLRVRPTPLLFIHNSRPADVVSAPRVGAWSPAWVPPRRLVIAPDGALLSVTT